MRPRNISPPVSRAARSRPGKPPTAYLLTRLAGKHAAEPAVWRRCGRRILPWFDARNGLDVGLLARPGASLPRLPCDHGSKPTHVTDGRPCSPSQAAPDRTRLSRRGVETESTGQGAPSRRTPQSLPQSLPESPPAVLPSTLGTASTPPAPLSAQRWPLMSNPPLLGTRSASGCWRKEAAKAMTRPLKPSSSRPLWPPRSTGSRIRKRSSARVACASASCGAGTTGENPGGAFDPTARPIPGTPGPLAAALDRAPPPHAASLFPPPDPPQPGLWVCSVRQVQPQRGSPRGCGYSGGAVRWVHPFGRPVCPR